MGSPNAPFLTLAQLLRNPLVDDQKLTTWQWAQFFRNIKLPALLSVAGTVPTTINVDNVWTELAGMSVLGNADGQVNLILVTLVTLADAANSDYDIAIYDGDDNQLFGIYTKNPFANVGNAVSLTFADGPINGQFSYKLKARVRQAAASVTFGLPTQMQLVTV